MNVSRLIILFFIYLNWSCTVSVEKLSLSLNQNEKETENENEIEDEITQRGFLVVSQNKHFLEFENGTEFFFMGDTAYHIPSLSKTKIDEYMNDRVKKNSTQFWLLPTILCVQILNLKILLLDHFL